MMCNNLYINRLRVVTNKNDVAYDECFHKGINIIRGQNSSGKSTITHLLFFVLGGYYNSFVPEVLKCRYVMAELDANGTVITVLRYLEKTDKGINPYTPMYIYWGEMNQAMNVPMEGNWQRYGYKMSSESKSFSNVLFELLGLPIMKADSNVTMYQILRLMYVDQESPTGSLFFYDTFDREIIRETTSDLLLGVYNEQLSHAKLELIELERTLSEKKGEIRMAKEFLSHSNTRSSQVIQEYIDACTDEISTLTASIEVIRQTNRVQSKVTPTYVVYQKQISELRCQKNACEMTLRRLDSEIHDSQYFIDTLERKLLSLEKSMNTRSYLDKLPIEFCPDCLTRLDDNVPVGHCRLCKSPIDNTRGRALAFRMKLEIEFQIKESRKLLEEDMQEYTKTKSQLKVFSSALVAAQSQLDNAMQCVQNSKDEKIDQLIQKRGFKEGEILQYRTLLEQALQFESLLSEERELNNKMLSLRAFIKESEERVDRRRVEINRIISHNGAYLLSHDEERQAEFRNPDNFVVDFKQNTAYINAKENKFSASSAFYLKLAARFAILFASIEEPSMMYPRLLFADNMEDKGIEVQRAQNFQHLIVNWLTNQKNSDYQVIYATSTSFIPEDLNIEQYVVGESYTEDNKSLKNV